MKKFKSVICVAFLLVIAAFACLLTACDEKDYDDYRKEFFNSYSDIDRYAAAESGSAPVTVGSLDIEWEVGNVTVQKDAALTEISFSEETVGIDELGEDKKLHYFNDGSTLHLRYSAPGAVFATGASKDLTVKVPADMYFVNIEAAGGEVNVGGVKARILKLECVNANVTVNADASSLKVNTVAGNINAQINSAASEADLESVSGRIDATVNAALGELDIESVSGNITATLSAYVGEASIDSLSGAIDLTYNSGASSIESDVESAGSVAVKIHNSIGFTLTTLATFALPNGMTQGVGNSYVYGAGGMRVEIERASALSVSIL